MDAAASIAELLERSGLTKSELSRRSGVSRALIDDYLKGKRQPSVVQLQKLGESAGFRPAIVWLDATVANRPTRWGEVQYEEFPRKSLEEKSRVLELVVAMAWELPSKPRGDLTYPSLRRLARERESAVRS